MSNLSFENTRLNALFIQEVNFAAQELKYFIHLNVKLLPLFIKLTYSEEDSIKKSIQKVKIRETLELNRIDENMSFIFFNSPILCMINDCHQAIIKKQPINVVQFLFNDFIVEYNQLLKKWDLTAKN